LSTPWNEGFIQVTFLQKFIRNARGPDVLCLWKIRKEEGAEIKKYPEREASPHARAML
jgi:hypothetical protein